MKKILSILIIFSLIFSGLVLTIPTHNIIPIKAHILDATPDHYWIGTTTDSTLSTNWQPAAVPAAGDNIYFSALSTGNCNWALTGSYGSFNLLANFTRTVTQAASFSVTSYSQAAGIFTGNANYVLTDSGNFLQTGGTISDNTLIVNMTGVGTTFSMKAATALYRLIISANVLITSTDSGFRVYGLNVANSAIATIDAGKSIALGTWNGGAWSFINSGAITGTGILTFDFLNTNRAIIFGTITAPVIIQLIAGSNSYICTLSGAVVFGSSLSISSDTVFNMTLDLSASNYALSATDITIGTRGILKGRASQITCSGNWDSSASSDTASSLSSAKLYLTGTSKTLKQSSAERFGSIMLSGSYTMQSNVYTNNYWNNGTMTKAGYTLYVNNNQATTFTSSSVTQKYSGNKYWYNVTGYDREADTKTYGLSTNFTGLSINSGSGVTTSAATPYRHGSYYLHYSISDGNHTTYQNITLNIIWATVFSTNPQTNISSGQNYVYYPVSNVTSTWTFISNASWLSFDPSTHLVYGSSPIQSSTHTYWINLTISTINGYNWQNYTLQTYVEPAGTNYNLMIILMIIIMSVLTIGIYIAFRKD